MITGIENSLLDYYVEAVDLLGNTARTDIQHVFVGSSTITPSNIVTINPNPAQAGQPVTITYDPSGGPLASASQVYLHYGFNDWETVSSPDVAMTWNANSEKWDATIPVSMSANVLDMVFNNGSNVWDNNNGQDWQFAVEGALATPEFEMDGLLDAEAQLIASNGTRGLYAAVEGDILYLATQDAGEGNDVFIYLADMPGAMQPANWAKSGQIAGWDAFLADENNNNFVGWFDAMGSNEAASGNGLGFLEGTINLAEEFGVTPDQIYLAVGLYQSQDGGMLVSSQQVPASLDGNGSINPGEYILLQLSTPYTADFDNDGDVDGADLEIWQGSFGVNDLGDTDDDGDTDGRDFLEWQRQFGSGVSTQIATLLTDSRGELTSATNLPVPEPSCGWLLVSIAIVSSGSRMRNVNRKA
jgi:hypothetical protein